ncbi:kinase-like domain-containing protein [Entophlyctis helioformis]|nr:kinase-like domain-containing protein [Entophlyctis helioformis]
MFSFIKHVLARRDVSIIFISCHPDMSELTLFVRHYAQWLQSNTSEGLRPALTNFYIDQSREAYLFFGLCSRIESIRSLQMSIMMRMKSRKWRRAIKSRQRATAKARAKVGPRPSAVDYNPFGPQSQQSQQHQQPHPQHPTSGKVAPAPTLMVRKSDPSDPSAAALTDTDMDILSDDIGAGVMAGLTNSVCNKSVWQMVKDFMACKMTAALGSQQAKVDMLWQTPGVCVVQDGRVIYMVTCAVHTALARQSAVALITDANGPPCWHSAHTGRLQHEFQDYSRRAAAAISGMSMDASGTKKKHDFPHTPTDHLGEFINTITADDADADADVDAAASGSGNNSGGSIANPTTLNSLSQSPQSTDKSQVSPSTSLVASPLPATSPPPPPSNKYPELSLGERIGQGRESEVFVSHLNGKIVAVKYFRRPSPASPTGGGGGGPTSSGIGTLKPKGLQPANMSGAGGPKVGSPAIMLGLRSMARSGKGVMDAGDTLASFSNEVAMLMALRHTNVVKFVGFGSLDSRHFLLTEFMGRGSVFDLLASKDHLDSRRKWRIIMDAATGMEYLHGCRPSIIHQDLKSLNLLVADDWTVKVADFGIALELTPANLAARSRSIANHRSRNKLSEDDGGGGGGGGGGPIKSAGDLSNTNGLGTNNKEMDGGGGHGGTLQWMAPELLTGRPVMPSSKIDVFAFGVILWEVATRKKPWRGVNTRVITESILAGSRLPKSENWVMDLRMLVDACWNQDQSLRPEFKSIRQSLKTIVFPST